MTKLKRDTREMGSRRKPGVGSLDDEVAEVLVDAANGVNWQFKYRKSSPSRYRWEFVGGPPLTASDPTTFTPSATTFQNNSGPQITIPFAGEYLPYVFSDIQALVAALPATLGVNLAGSALINGTAKTMAVNGISDITYQSDWLTFKAGDVLNIGYQTSSANNLSYAGRIMTLIPRRVSF
jgi:hypothetical protein